MKRVLFLTTAFYLLSGFAFSQSLLQKLPILNDYSISFQQSSYDKTGLNVDYITPKDSNYYDVIPEGKVNNPQGVASGNMEYVICHVIGPAVLERFWMITYPPIYVNARFRFYFDGESVPRIDKTFQELFVEQKTPFIKPLVQEFNEASGGNYSYIRMPIAKSLIVTIDLPGLYYQFQSRQLARDSIVESWTPDSDQTMIEKEFLQAGTYPKTNFNLVQRDSSDFNLESNQKKTIVINGAKSIESLKLSIPDLDFSHADYIKDNGVFHKGKSSFNLKVDNSAQKILLVKRSNKTYHAVTNFTSLYERARVTINNTNIGNWENRDYRAHRYWQNDTIIIPKEIVKDESSLKIQMQYLNGEPWSEYYYWIICDGVQTDSIDLGDILSQQQHNYTITNSQNVPYNQITGRYDTPKSIRNNNLQILDSLYIHIYFDDDKKPSVSAPIGLFFGTGVKDASYMKAIPSGNIGGEYYNFFTMPFWKNAKIELENIGQRFIDNITFKWTVADNIYPEKETGYFKTAFRREVKLANDSSDYLLADIDGRGVLVGTILEVNQDDNTITCWLEGDEHIYIDGAKTPQFIGTGTEDYFNSTFYFYFDEYSLPQNGMTNSDYFFHRSMYRYHLTDPIYFENNLRFQIEHGDYNNKQGNYSSLLFYYWKPSETILTDSIDIGNPASEALHQYETTSSKVFLKKNLAFEGEKFLYKELHDGYAIQDYSSWVAKIDAQNNGVRLLRVFDYTYKNQSAEVYIDDTLVGIWLNPGFNTNNYARDDFFDIPAKYTQGKSSIKIRIVNTNTDEVWTEMYYKVFSRINESGTITDIKEIKAYKPFSIYPTITQNRVSIDNKDNEVYRLRIFDSNGKILKDLDYLYDYTKTIDLSHLSSGLYFLQIIQSDKIVQTEKVIVIK